MEADSTRWDAISARVCFAAEIRELSGAVRKNQRHPRSGQTGHASFIAESFGGWDGDGVASGQQAGEKRAKSEERGGCEQTACGKGALHPVGQNGAEKAVKGKADNNARGRADERDACGDPQDVRAGRTERQADAKLRSALRNAVSDDAEDANQRERERHGRENAKQYGEEELAVVLAVGADRQRPLRPGRGWSAGT